MVEDSVSFIFLSVHALATYIIIEMEDNFNSDLVTNHIKPIENLSVKEIKNALREGKAPIRGKKTEQLKR